MKKEVLKKIEQTVFIIRRFIAEQLVGRADVNESLIKEFENVLIKFQKSKEPNDLYKIVEIDSRPHAEGEKTDFTTGISLPIDGKYTSLMELFLDLQDQVGDYHRSE